MVSPAITASALRVLTRYGAEVVVVEGDGCCGALNHHLGQSKSFERLATRLVEDVTVLGRVDALVTTTSGCGTVMRDYGFELGTEQAGIVGRSVRDVADVLAGLPLQRVAALPTLRVAYHAPCSLAHGMRRGFDVPEALTKLGFDVVTPRESTARGSQVSLHHEHAWEIVQALDVHLCRCGAHSRMIRAVQRAAASTRSEKTS